MKRKTPKRIDDKIWKKLEERDYLLTNSNYFKILLDYIRQGKMTESDEMIKAYEVVVARCKEIGSVTKIIDSIDDKELEDHDHYLVFSRRFERPFQTSGLTLDDLAKELGLSHTAISNSYLHTNGSGKRPNLQIHKHYLKAYSLIFGVSPYYLLGLPDEPKKYVLNEEDRKLQRDKAATAQHLPIIAVDAEVFEETLGYDLIWFIATSIYQAPPYSGPDMMYALSIISFFCNAKHETRESLKKALMLVPKIGTALESPIAWAMETNFINEYDPLFEEEKRVIDYSVKNVWEALKELHFKDFFALQLLAVLMRQEPQLVEVLSKYLSVGGFWDKPYEYLKKWECAGVVLNQHGRKEVLPAFIKASDRIRAVPESKDKKGKQHF